LHHAAPATPTPATKKYTFDVSFSSSC